MASHAILGFTYGSIMPGIKNRILAFFAAFAAMIKTETAKWREIVRSAKITIE